ncbi:cupin domain-containing protein [Deinococcus sp.]|uniref:cupin domain-containing protein n=1 Tax=Deinococcus sp. TaxID=47478 RepID=UPI003CC5B4D7
MPDALHLLRLARTSPGLAVSLPGDGLSVLHLTARQDGGEAACWYVCLEGTLILDLPHGDFAELRPGDGYAAAAGTARTLLPLGSVTVLMVSG